jgi:glycosyltransferase involved in cell wall biosynthesis
MPRVSVVMPSYNHAPYIRDAIISVLSQTVKDIELIVVDDGSSDNSNEVISSVTDDRLHHVPLSTNVGACEAMNIAIGMSRGDYVAVCNSDDVWEHDKLERQVCVMEQMPSVSAVFSNVSWINEAGTLLPDNELPDIANVFSRENRSRFAWLRELVEEGNCLCHPSVLIKRSVYENIGVLNNLLRQLPDLDIWIRLLQNYEIHVLKDRLVKFRLHDLNTSRSSPASDRRSYRERILISRQLFGEISPDNFYSAFMSDKVARSSSVDNPDFIRDKVSYLCNATGVFKNELMGIGIELAYSGSQTHGFNIIDPLDFQALTASIVNQGFSHKRSDEFKRTVKNIIGRKAYSSIKRVIGRSYNNSR